MRTLFAACVLALAAPAVAAPPSNPQIDYAGFEALTESVGEYREKRLLSWEEFAAAARRPDTLILDARSADAYRAGHIRGAVNLPFTDFTAESLARVIGDKDRPILIYCNNNFRNDRPPVQMKLVQLALNIQTFINLVGYGYGNVHELGETSISTTPGRMGNGRTGRRALRRGVTAALAIGVAGAPLQAQSFTVPPPASPLRKAVLDGLRPAVEKRLGQGVEFKVTLVRVQRDWAFVVADPQRRGGRTIDGYRIFGEHFDNMDGLRVEAVLRRRGGRWIVVDHGIGATDVWYCDVGPRSLKRDWGC